MGESHTLSVSEWACHSLSVSDSVTVTRRHSVYAPQASYNHGPRPRPSTSYYCSKWKSTVLASAIQSFYDYYWDSVLDKTLEAHVCIVRLFVTRYTFKTTQHVCVASQTQFSVGFSCILNIGAKLVKKKGKGSFYIAQYPVRWTAQSASHLFSSPADLLIPTPFLAFPAF